MPFPPVDRVRYEVNPLEEVICQLRFPPILRIDAEVPSAFQDKIREDYPSYNAAPHFKLPAGLSPEMSSMLGAEFSTLVGSKLHRFESSALPWFVTLRRDSLSLSCGAYESWEDFSRRLNALITAFVEIYKPKEWTRLGLRYRDLFRRSKFQLNDVPWGKLLRPSIAGVLADPSLPEDELRQTMSQSVIALPDAAGLLRIQHGLELLSDSGETETDPESCYRLDADFALGQSTRIDDAIPKLNALHVQARRFFRWCITDQLHQAMRPRLIEPAVVE